MIPHDTDNLARSPAAETAVPFEDRPCLEAELSDLSAESMKDYLCKTGFTYRQVQDRDLVSMAQNMHLLAGPPDASRPTNAAVLMFCPAPEKFFPHAGTEVTLMPRRPGGSMEKKTFAQPLHTQLQFALQFIRNMAVGEMVIKHQDVPEAERVPSYPKYAIEAVLANAVYCHSYGTQEPIKVRIFPTGIEVTCHPGYAPGITEEDIISGNLQGKVHGNERIWSLLKAAALAEVQGANYLEASGYLSRNGSGALEFRTDPDMCSLTVTIPVHPYFLPKVSEQDKAFRDRIFAALQDKEMSSTELAAAMGYRGITRKLSAAVNDMLTEGMLYRVPAGIRMKLKAAHSALRQAKL